MEDKKIMAWDLEIHIIDVGQGESSLIIAADPAVGQRTMLIDGGFPEYGRFVHDYIIAQGLQGVDHILTSHYDDDHSSGIIALLQADNLYHICAIIAQTAGAAADDAATNAPAPNRGQDYQVAAAAAAAVAAILGGYNNPGGNNYSNLAVQAGQAVWVLAFAPGSTNARVARDGIAEGERIANTLLRNALLVPLTSTPKRRAIAQAAGIAAGTTIGNAGARSTAALTAVFNEMSSMVAPSSRFQTGGGYRNVHIIDIGNTPHMPAEYPLVIGGRVSYTSGGAAIAPGVNRMRTSNPNLGDEVLWNSGRAAGPGVPPPVAMPAPMNSPAIFVVACRKYIWQAPAFAVPIASGQPDNDDSLGLILRFNQFFYYTGGDLPSQGEDLIANAIMANGLPNPLGGPGAAFAIPHRIACFKCGHHGADGSTSANFLNTAMPRGAFLSCGFNPSFRHPTQNVINRLNNVNPIYDIEYFYLTNCKFDTNHIPASQGNNNQLNAPGNKSRVCGDNDDFNRAAGRNRGDITILISEAESTSPNIVGPLMAGQVLRQYSVEYFEDDAAVQNFRQENTVF
jgi:beta-lactamase superfamily II metal-dependent hydrolase